MPFKVLTALEVVCCGETAPVIVHGRFFLSSVLKQRVDGAGVVVEGEEVGVSTMP